MNLLQTFERWDELIEFDIESDTLGTVKFRSEDFKQGNVPFIGVITHLNNHVVLLYRKDEHLHLSVDSKSFLLDENTVIQVEPDHAKQEPTNKLSLYQDNQLKFSLEYVLGALIPGDPTPFVELEDFDFGVYLKNILTQPGRMNRMYRIDLSN